MRACRLLFMLLLISWSVALCVQAEVSHRAEQEINHLLDYIEHSGCSFIRNGTVYEAGKAAEHIRTKYDYIRAKINSTEDFVTYAATKSSITGIAYQVRCGETSMKSGDWLLHELENFRRTGLSQTQLSHE